MSGEIGHNCGWCITHSLNDVYDFGKSLNHRGRDAAGIMAVADDRIDVLKWTGTFGTLDLIDLYKIFPNDNNYHTYGAHVRYATRGRKEPEKILQDAHPHVIGGRTEHKGNHIVIRDCEAAAIHNGQVNESYLPDVDGGALRTECDTERLLHFYYQKGELEMLREVPGAYTIAIADKRKKPLIVARDKHGIRIGILGRKDGKTCAASESVAFFKNKGEFEENLSPGYVYYLNPDGSYVKEKAADGKLQPCFFEWNYIAHLQSVIDGVGVWQLRDLLGAVAAKGFKPPHADFVTFLPRCPEVAAKRYSKETGIPFVYVFYKLRGERAFQGPTDEERVISIGENLHLLDKINGMPAREFLKGKTAVNIDDSMIRGNNSKRARDLLYEAGVKKIYHHNYTPPVGIIGDDEKPRFCPYGVDMPENDNFIARGRTIEEIGREMEMGVVYNSPKAMLSAFRKLGLREKDLCTFCIGGKDPLGYY